MIYKLVAEKGKPFTMFTAEETEITENTNWSKREISPDELVEFMKRVFRQEVEIVDESEGVYKDAGE